MQRSVDCSRQPRHRLKHNLIMEMIFFQYILLKQSSYIERKSSTHILNKINSEHTLGTPEVKSKNYKTY